MSSDPQGGGGGAAAVQRPRVNQPRELKRWFAHVLYSQLPRSGRKDYNAEKLIGIVKSDLDRSYTGQLGDILDRIKQDITGGGGGGAADDEAAAAADASRRDKARLKLLAAFVIEVKDSTSIPKLNEIIQLTSEEQFFQDITTEEDRRYLELYVEIHFANWLLAAKQVRDFDQATLAAKYQGEYTHELTLELHQTYATLCPGAKAVFSRTLERRELGRQGKALAVALRAMDAPPTLEDLINRHQGTPTERSFRQWIRSLVHSAHPEDPHHFLLDSHQNFTQASTEDMQRQIAMRTQATIKASIQTCADLPALFETANSLPHPELLTATRVLLNLRHIGLFIQYKAEELLRRALADSDADLSAQLANCTTENCRTISRIVQAHPELAAVRGQLPSAADQARNDIRMHLNWIKRQASRGLQAWIDAYLDTHLPNFDPTAAPAKDFPTFLAEDVIGIASPTGDAELPNAEDSRPVLLPRLVAELVTCTSMADSNAKVRQLEETNLLGANRSQIERILTTDDKRCLWELMKIASTHRMQMDTLAYNRDETLAITLGHVAECHQAVVASAAMNQHRKRVHPKHTATRTRADAYLQRYLTFCLFTRLIRGTASQTSDVAYSALTGELAAGDFATYDPIITLMLQAMRGDPQLKRATRKQITVVDGSRTTSLLAVVGARARVLAAQRRREPSL